MAARAVMLASLKKDSDAHPRAIGNAFLGDSGQSYFHGCTGSVNVGAPVVQFGLFGGIEAIHGGQITGNAADAADIL